MERPGQDLGERTPRIGRDGGMAVKVRAMEGEMKRDELGCGERKKRIAWCG